MCKLFRTEIRIRWVAWSRDEIIFQNPSGRLGIFSLGLSCTVGSWRVDRGREREPQWWEQDLKLKEAHTVLEMGKSSGLVTSTGGLAPVWKTLCFSLQCVQSKRKKGAPRRDGLGGEKQPIPHSDLHGLGWAGTSGKRVVMPLPKVSMEEGMGAL